MPISISHNGLIIIGSFLYGILCIHLWIVPNWTQLQSTRGSIAFKSSQLSALALRPSRPTTSFNRDITTVFPQSVLNEESTSALLVIPAATPAQIPSLAELLARHLITISDVLYTKESLQLTLSTDSDSL